MANYVSKISIDDTTALIRDTNAQTLCAGLRADLTTETNNRISEDASIRADMNDAISAERVARENADDALNSLIEKEISDRKALISETSGNASINKTLVYENPETFNSYFKTVHAIDRNNVGYKILVANDNLKYIEHEYANVIEYGADNTGNSDSTNAIQNALRSGKKHVIFPSGMYICNWAKIPSNVHVQGFGAKLVATNATAIFTNDSSGSAGGYDANTNITIEGIDFSAPNPSTCTPVAFGHSSYITIRNCTFHDIKVWHFIEINSCNHSLIDNCLFYNYGTSEGGYTEMLQLDYMYNSSVFPWFGPYDGTINNDIKITNCSFVGTESLINGRLPSAIGNHTSGNATISNVNISNCYFVNMGSATKFVVCDRINVTNCLIENCENGLYGTNITHVIYTGNELSGRSDWEQNEQKRGIYTEGSGCSYITINNNIIAYFGGHGVTLQGSLIQMTSNTINTNGCHGMYIGWADFGSIYEANVSFDNNRIDGGFYDLILRLVQGTRESAVGDSLVVANKASTASITAPEVSNAQKSYFVQNFIKRTFDNYLTDWVVCSENYLNFTAIDGTLYSYTTYEAQTVAAQQWVNLCSLRLPAGTYMVRGVSATNDKGTKTVSSRITPTSPIESGRSTTQVDMPSDTNLYAYFATSSLVHLDSESTVYLDAWCLNQTNMTSRCLQAVKLH